MSILTKDRVQQERQVYAAIKNAGKITGNSQYIREGLIDDLLDTIDAMQEHDAALISATLACAAEWLERRGDRELDASEYTWLFGLARHVREMTPADVAAWQARRGK